MEYTMSSRSTVRTLPDTLTTATLALPETLYPDSRYFSPRVLWKQVMNLAKRALSRSHDIDIIGLTSTSQRQGIVLIDQNGDSFLGLPSISLPDRGCSPPTLDRGYRCSAAREKNRRFDRSEQFPVFDSSMSNQ